MDLRAHRLHHVNAPGGIDEFENGQPRMIGPGHVPVDWVNVIGPSQTHKIKNTRADFTSLAHCDPAELHLLLVEKLAANVIEQPITWTVQDRPVDIVRLGNRLWIELLPKIVETVIEPGGVVNRKAPRAEQARLKKHLAITLAAHAGRGTFLLGFQLPWANKQRRGQCCCKHKPQDHGLPQRSDFMPEK